MKRSIFSFLILFSLFVITSCSNEKSSEDNQDDQTENLEEKDDNSVLFSFTFLGCNRVDRHQEYDTSATNGTTANLAVLKRIFREISEMERKPELFFFLGDMVLAESTTDKLNSQLDAWVNLYKDPDFSLMADSDIEMVAVPGNHEMLYWHDYGDPNHDEWPLNGATDIWMKYMNPYMPKDRDHVTGTDSLNNRMTFSFVRHNVGFVLMNTDTYNAPTQENPHGLEGQIPTQWVIDKVAEYQKNPNIDHVFVLGHKPYYVNGQPETGHAGLPEGPVLWPKLNESHVVAMLSAHLHDYQRVQPGDKGTYQVIAGNAGSKGEATFFGYSTINIMKNGDVQLISKGFDKGNPYWVVPVGSKSTIRDSTILTWTKNANPYVAQ